MKVHTTEKPRDVIEHPVTADAFDYAPKKRQVSFMADPLHPPPQTGLVRMDDLERELNRRDPIGNIAATIRALTFGEMEQLAAELVENQGLGDIDAFAVMKRLHEWQKYRKVTSQE